jgi:hypothetical protein
MRRSKEKEKERVKGEGVWWRGTLGVKNKLLAVAPFQAVCSVARWHSATCATQWKVKTKAMEGQGKAVEGQGKGIRPPALPRGRTRQKHISPPPRRLHGNSKIILCVKETTDKAFFPINLGVYSLINRVVFKVGAKEISSISDFNHFMAYRNCFTPNEQNFERNSNGRYFIGLHCGPG